GVMWVWGWFFQAEDGIRDWSVTGVQTCALPIWASAQPLVVLLDYQMPRMDGFALLQVAMGHGQLLTKNEYIIITSEPGTFPEDFIDLLRRLSIRVLPKPFDKETLVSAVALAVERLQAPTEQMFPNVPDTNLPDAT